MVDITFFYAKFINWVNFCVVIENQINYKDAR